MMQSIIDDAAKLEEEATYGETTSQKDYEDFIQETNALVDSMTTSMINKARPRRRPRLISRRRRGNWRVSSIHSRIWRRRTVTCIRSVITLLIISMHGRRPEATRLMLSSSR